MPDYVAGVVGALAGVVLGQLLARSGEYSKWLRSERHRSAAELLACGEAFKRHAADMIGARYAGDPVDSEGHLADLERLALALEAVRTVFPGRTGALADDFGEAAQRLTHVAAGVAEVTPGEPTPGERYDRARRSFTEDVRLLIAPTPAGWLKLPRWRRE
jgi:hypothetical protein